MKTEHKGITYEQQEESDSGLCHGCAGYPCTEEADELCKELGEIGCCGMIWKEVTDEAM